MMAGLKLWWGLTEKFEFFFYPIAMFLWPIALLGEEIEKWWIFSLVALLVLMRARKNVRTDAGYAALNMPRKLWRRHQRCDVLIGLMLCLVCLGWALPWGGWQQISLMAVAVLFSLHALFGRGSYPVGSYVGESLKQRERSIEAAGDGEEKRPRKVRYPETLLRKSILAPQIRAWLGWAGFAATIVVCVILAGLLLGRNAMGVVNWILTLATGVGMIMVIGEIQRSYGEWIRFGGRRAVWARWTGLLCALPVGSVALIGALVGLGGEHGAASGMTGGLIYILLVLPLTLMLAIGDSTNVGWCLLLLAGMVIVGSLFVAEAIEAPEWFLLQGGLVALLLLCLPALIRGVGPDLKGFFGAG